MNAVAIAVEGDLQVFFSKTGFVLEAQYKKHEDKPQAFVGERYPQENPETQTSLISDKE
jgi:hypothetical protein